MEKSVDKNESNWEEGEESLARLIKLAGEDARARRRIAMDSHSKKLREAIAEGKAHWKNLCTHESETQIYGRYYRSIANCIKVLPDVDRIYFYDNSETDADPLPMFRAANGKIAKVYNDLVPWAKNIADLLV